jgi:hypothetical protein
MKVTKGGPGPIAGDAPGEGPRRVSLGGLSKSNGAGTGGGAGGADGTKVLKVATKRRALIALSCDVVLSEHVHVLPDGAKPAFVVCVGEDEGCLGCLAGIRRDERIAILVCNAETKWHEWLFANVPHAHGPRTLLGAIEPLFEHVGNPRAVLTLSRPDRMSYEGRLDFIDAGAEERRQVFEGAQARFENAKPPYPIGERITRENAIKRFPALAVAVQANQTDGKYTGEPGLGRETDGQEADE